MNLLLITVIAISLSMDAFSLSLAYGMLGIPKKQCFLLSIIVGLFHFFMPLIGMIIGNHISNILNISSHIIIFIVLLIIGSNMIYESFKDEELKKMKFFELFLFAFAVSLDSFSVGLTLSSIYNNWLISAILFAVSSCLFTYIGLQLGNKIKKSVGKYSTIVGGCFLIIIALLYL